MKTELLAPAKNKDIAIAAINCGADAVYIGAPSFGARKQASNSIDDIKDIVNYAHKFWAKVFVTMNTILTDTELLEAVELANKLAKIGIDALIIQDMGLLKKLIDINYKIPVHISTQCDNYLPEKIKFFNRIGVSRVVLARELSLKQIQEIHNDNPDLELEAFIHGALCVSMSGQCYLSANIGGRSANRGECAQPCRKKYTIETTEGKILKKDTYALCLKDFNATKNISDMVNAGVYSFKIEGRLKDENYVKNIVAHYSKLLPNKSSSGRSVITFTPDPDKSFNRGFTNYFLEKRTDCFNFESPKSRGKFIGKVAETRPDSFKIDQIVKINPQDGLYFNGVGCLVNKFENGYIYPNKKINIKIGTPVFKNFDVEFEKEVKKSTRREIGTNISIKDNIITITDENSVIVQKKLPLGEKAKDQSKMNENFIKQISKTGDTDFYVNSIELKQDINFIPISAINELRRTLFSELMQKRLEIYNSDIKETQKKMQYAKYFIDSLDYHANIHNKEALEFYKTCGVNKIIEESFESKHPARQVQLMRCKHCIKYALNMCKTKTQLVLRDELGKIYPLQFNCNKCEMSVLSPN